jgi:Na+/melibiose symporter-like transporter
VSFVMFGVLFAVPQYYQAILGADAMGGGIRLLPMIGGMLAGAVVADRFAVRVGARAAVGLGFVLLAGAMLAGATTSAGSGYGLAAAWITVAGLGLGFVMPVVMDAAIGTLREEAVGVGSGVRRHPGRADRRGGRGLPQHGLPLLPDKGRPGHHR